MSIFRRFIARNIGLPAYEYFKNVSVKGNLRLLESAWIWTKSEMEAYQLNRLKSLLDFAEKTSPFYRNRFASCGFNAGRVQNLSDLVNLEPLTRDDINQNLSTLISSKKSIEDAVKGSSSGTTGTPISYYKDRSTIGMGKAALFFGQKLAGWLPGDKTVNVWGNPATVYKQWKKPSSRINAFLMNETRIPACELNSKSYLDEVIHILQKTKPIFMSGYTNSILILARRAALKNLDISCRGVFTTAETLLDSTRQTIESTFGPVFDFYGCSEINGIAFQCPYCLKYHTFDPHVIVEFEPYNGIDGYSILVTDLDNYTMPLIRYRVGDIAFMEPSYDPCPSGSSWRTFTAITGRLAEIIEHNGRYINPITYFGDSLGKLLTGRIIGLSTYQTVWDGTEFITTLYLTEQVNPDILNEVTIIMNKRLESIGAVHNFRECYEPFPDTAGKRSFFINEANKVVSS